jgi:hypothetical protein
VTPVSVAKNVGALDWSRIQKWNQLWSHDG